MTYPLTPRELLFPAILASPLAFRPPLIPSTPGGDLVHHVDSYFLHLNPSFKKSEVSASRGQLAYPFHWGNILWAPVSAPHIPLLLWCPDFSIIPLSTQFRLALLRGPTPLPALLPPLALLLVLSLLRLSVVLTLGNHLSASFRTCD